MTARQANQDSFTKVVESDGSIGHGPNEAARDSNTKDAGNRSHCDNGCVNEEQSKSPCDTEEDTASDPQGEEEECQSSSFGDSSDLLFGEFNSFEVGPEEGAAYARLESYGGTCRSAAFWCICGAVGAAVVLGLGMMFLASNGGVKTKPWIIDSKSTTTHAPFESPSSRPDVPTTTVSSEEIMMISLNGFSCGFPDDEGNEFCISGWRGICVRLNGRFEKDTVRVRVANPVNIPTVCEGRV